MTRAEWLASLQTFDRVLLRSTTDGTGFTWTRVEPVVVTGNGAVHVSSQECLGGRDMREPQTVVVRGRRLT